LLYILYKSFINIVACKKLLKSILASQVTTLNITQVWCLRIVYVINNKSAGTNISNRHFKYFVDCDENYRI